MFSYYGSKSKIVDYYPKPKFGKIIEPFAGSARYSLKHFENDVLLVDKWPVIVNLWNWLRSCSKKDILSMPEIKYNETLADLKFDCEEQKNLLGFIIGNGNQHPRNKANFRSTLHRPNKQNYSKKLIASQLFKIKHWEIKLGSFDEIDNQNATWFIDPPYQNGGECYIESSKKINFTLLGDWCKEREGQTIVCENTKANWLPFSPMKFFRGSTKQSTEAIWTNYKTAYNNIQQSIF